MDFDGMDRRGFLALGGGALFCTLAGHKISADEGQIDVDGLAKGVEVPPKVAAADAAGGAGRERRRRAPAPPAPPSSPPSPSTARRANTGSLPSRSSGTSSPPAATR